jgi:hypothetical protein
MSALLLMLLIAAAEAGAAPDQGAPGSAAGGRRDPERVQAELRKILARPEYRVEAEPAGKSLSRWLDEKIGAFFEGFVGLSDRHPWLFLVILLWLLGSLAAILVHLVFVIVRSLVGGRSPLRRPGRLGEWESAVEPQPPSPQQLLEEARAEARAGRFAEAVRLLHLALILFLHRLKQLTFDESKTNGEYLLELARAGPGARAVPFRLATDLCEGVVYGRAPCSAEVLRRMWTLTSDVGLTSDDGEGTR